MTIPMSAKEAAKLLGVKQRHVYQLIWRKKLPIPYRKTESGRILFDEKDIKQWFESLPKYVYGREV